MLTWNGRNVPSLWKTTSEFLKNEKDINTELSRRLYRAHFKERKKVIKEEWNGGREKGKNHSVE